MFRKILKTLPLAAVALGVCSGVAMAGKSNDTLVWATDRETAVVDPYYNRTRELVIMGHAGWDGLLYRNVETGEYEPLLAKSYKWGDNLTLDSWDASACCSAFSRRRLRSRRLSPARFRSASPKHLPPRAQPTSR